MIDISVLSSMSALDLIDELSIRIYEPPLANLRWSANKLPVCLQTLFLVIDFDTEVAMNSILGFLENLTGRFVPETIEALDRISAPKTADALRTIQRIMERHGVTSAGLREDFARISNYQITSFSELHGHNLGAMADEIIDAARGITCDDTAEEPVRILLSHYIESNRSSLLSQVELAVDSAGKSDPGYTSGAHR